MDYKIYSNHYAELINNISDHNWTADYNYRNYHKRRFYYYLQKLPNNKEIKILDIGSSIFTLLLKDAGYNSITSIDLTDDWKDTLEKEGIDFYKVDILNSDNKELYGMFDLVIFNETLEHLYMPFIKIFNKLSKYLKDDWSIIIWTPNFSSLDKRLRVLCWFNSSPLFIEENLEQYHVREYTVWELKKLFKQYWYNIDDYSYPLYFDFPNKTNNIILYIYRIFLFPIKLLIPSLRKAIYMKVSKK